MEDKLYSLIADFFEQKNVATGTNAYSLAEELVDFLGAEQVEIDDSALDEDDEDDLQEKKAMKDDENYTFMKNIGRC